MTRSTFTVTAYGWRAWLYMLLNLPLGGLYFGLLCAGYAAGFALSVIWIGLPILSLVMIATRKLANLDRWFAALMIGMELAPIPEDLNVSSSNPLSYVGAHLASAVTWQQVVYLFLKLPLGLVSFVLAAMVTPFLVVEMILGVLGINLGGISPRIVRAMGAGLSGASGGLIPAIDDVFAQQAAEQAAYEREKARAAAAARQRKRATKTKNDLMAHDEYDEAEYFIDDDGEIGVYYR